MQRTTQINESRPAFKKKNRVQLVPRRLSYHTPLSRLWASKRRDGNETIIQRLQATVVLPVTALEPAMHALTLTQLRFKTTEFRSRLADGATLDDILPEVRSSVETVDVNSNFSVYRSGVEFKCPCSAPA